MFNEPLSYRYVLDYKHFLFGWNVLDKAYLFTIMPRQLL